MILDMVNELKKLWVAAMPTECPLPEFDLLQWAESYDQDDVESAIVRSAKKMRLNLRQGVSLQPRAAQRYATSVLTNLHKARLERQRRHELLREIGARFFTGDDVDFAADPPGEDYHRLRYQRLAFKQSATTLVETMIADGATDGEIWERVIMLHEVMQGDFVSTVLPDLQEGQQRLFFTPEQLGKFFASAEHDRILAEHDTVVRLGMDGRFAVDIIAKSDEVSDKVRRES